MYCAMRGGLSDQSAASFAVFAAQDDILTAERVDPRDVAADD